MKIIFTILNMFAFTFVCNSGQMRSVFAGSLVAGRVRKLELEFLLRRQHSIPRE